VTQATEMDRSGEEELILIPENNSVNNSSWVEWKSNDYLE
jgi:hypothetical protein